MESDWRWLIWALGMQHAGWELCARVLVLPPNINFIVKVQGSNIPQLWRLPAPGQLPVHIGFFPAPPAGVHFPYGWPVLPD